MEETGVPKSSKWVGVCLNDYSDNLRLLEEAERTARREKCPWIAIYIAQESYDLDPISKERLQLSFDRAREAGATVVQFPSTNIIQGILTASELHHVTHLVVGKRRKSRLLSFFRPTLAATLLKHDVPFELQIVTIEEAPKDSHFFAIPKLWRSYAVCLSLILVLTAAIDFVQESLPEYQFNASIYNVSMVYLLAVVFFALRYGFWPATISALLSFGLYNYLFIPPFYEFGLNQISDVLNFILFLSASIVSVTVANVYKRNLFSLKERELAARALHDLTRDLNSHIEFDKITNTLGAHLQEILKNDIVLLLGEQELHQNFPHGVSQKTIDSNAAH